MGDEETEHMIQPAEEAERKAKLWLGGEAESLDILANVSSACRSPEWWRLPQGSVLRRASGSAITCLGEKGELPSAG